MDLTVKADIFLGVGISACIALVTMRAWRLYAETEMTLLRYRLFELRDDLAKLLVFGHIEPDQQEYLYVKKISNALLPGMEDIRFRVIVRAFQDITAEEDREYEKMWAHIKTRPEIMRIYAAVMGIAWTALYRNSLIFRMLLCLAVWIARFRKRFKGKAKHSRIDKIGEIGNHVSIFNHRYQKVKKAAAITA